MPPLALLPSRPLGSPDIASYGYGGGMGPTASSAGGSYIGPEGRTVPRATPEDPYAEVRWWQQYNAEVAGKAMSEQNAFEKLKWEQQRQDSEKALQNAMNIAKLQVDNSRYGTDVQRDVQLAQLRVNQDQFEMRHALDVRSADRDDRRLGLDYANAYTNFAQTQDNPWLLKTWGEAVNNVAGGGAPGTISAGPQPRGKTWADFAALTGFGNVPGVQQSQSGAINAMTGATGAGAGSGGQDLRLKAMKAIGEAIPPSETMGADDQDWAALNAFKSLYFAGRPDTPAKLGKENMKIGLNGLARQGYNVPLIEEERIRSGIGQGSSRAY